MGFGMQEAEWLERHDQLRAKPYAAQLVPSYHVEMYSGE